MNFIRVDAYSAPANEMSIFDSRFNSRIIPNTIELHEKLENSIELHKEYLDIAV